MSSQYDTQRPGTDDERREATSRRRGSASRRGFLAATGVAAAGSLGGCLGALESGPDTVTFGTLTIPAVAEVLIAKEKGYFEDRDIELEVERIQSAPKATPQLASGDLDVATGSIGASLFNSVAQDIEINVVADQTQYWRGQPSSNRVLVRPDLYSEGMSLSDLPEGFTVALHGQGNVDSYILGRLLQRNDMTWDDVETKEILYPNMTGAMEAGEIDACSIPDPLGAKMMKQAGAKRLAYASEVAPTMQIGVYLFGGPFMDDRPDVARRWLEAYLLGVREYYEMGGFPDEEVAGIVSEEFGIPEGAIRVSIPSLPHKNGQVDVESVMNQQEYHACRGLVEETVDADAVVDESFLEDALDEVGRLDEEEATPSVETIHEWSEDAPAPYPPVGEIDPPESFPDESICE